MRASVDGGVAMEEGRRASKDDTGAAMEPRRTARTKDATNGTTDAEQMMEHIRQLTSCTTPKRKFG